MQIKKLEMDLEKQFIITKKDKTFFVEDTKNGKRLRGSLKNFFIQQKNLFSKENKKGYHVFETYKHYKAYMRQNKNEKFILAKVYY